jgi:hypothetical protein
MDVLTDVLRVVGARVRVQGSVTVNGSDPVLTGAGEQNGAIYTTIHGRVRVDHSAEEAIELSAGDALFLMTGTGSLNCANSTRFVGNHSMVDRCETPGGASSARGQQ